MRRTFLLDIISSIVAYHAIDHMTLNLSNQQGDVFFEVIKLEIRQRKCCGQHCYSQIQIKWLNLEPKWWLEAGISWDDHFQ